MGRDILILVKIEDGWVKRSADKLVEGDLIRIFDTNGAEVWRYETNTFSIFANSLDTPSEKHLYGGDYVWVLHILENGAERKLALRSRYDDLKPFPNLEINSEKSNS